MKLIILTCVYFILSVSVYSQNNEIAINVSGLRTDKGKCLLYLFNNKKGFPTDATRAIKTATITISNGKSTIIMKDIADGEYAITIIHDENDNGNLDTNFLGMPKEGVGVSNNAKGKMGPPGYEDSKFQLENKSMILNITMHYL